MTMIPINYNRPFSNDFDFDQSWMNPPHMNNRMARFRPMFDDFDFDREVERIRNEMRMEREKFFSRTNNFFRDDFFNNNNSLDFPRSQMAPMRSSSSSSSMLPRSTSFADFNFPAFPDFPEIKPPREIVHTDMRNDGGRLDMSFTLPEPVDPSRINVTVRDGEIEIKAEDKKEGPNEKSSFSFYQRSTLPPNTDYNQLKATLNNNRLSITAPPNQQQQQNYQSSQRIPIDNGRHF